jgi:hypothetical protein
MFKKIAIAAGVSLALSSAAQAEYQFEIGANAGTGDFDIDSVEADQDFFGLTAAYYLQSVDTSKGPLSEAAFLDRASSIELLAGTGEIDFDDFGDADVDSYAIGTRLVAKESGWLVELGYGLDKWDGIVNEDIDTYSIGAGKYVLENTAIVLSYTKLDSDLEGDSDAYDLGVEHLWHFADMGALKLDATVGRVDPDLGDDDIDVWGLGGTYYVNDKLGFGAGYAQEDSDDTDLQNWSLFAEWFVTEKVALALAYTDSEDKDIGLETDAVMFTADVRF